MQKVFQPVVQKYAEILDNLLQFIIYDTKMSSSF